MCRHVCYLGPRLPLAEVVASGPHSLVRQTYAPVDMRGGGTINVDGFGVGWYPDVGRPRVYRRAVPMWTDTNFVELSPVLTSGTVVAAVRSATEGMPVTDAACAPFRGDGLLFSHNGLIVGWPSVGRRLMRSIPEDSPVAEQLLTTPSLIDSVLVFALVRQRLAEGADLAGALSTVLGEVLAEAPESRLNLLITDGNTVVATTWTHTLWTRYRSEALMISSEPFDDGADWYQVPDRRLVVGTAAGIDMMSAL